MLRRLGHRVPVRRIRESLYRVDPVRRVFGRVKIKRRTYKVPGPNSLWHHDGQHGLIRWGIVIHGFIDGYSRLITGLRASNNNRGSTVLDLFLRASGSYGVPSRLRGDHGVENIQVAAWMELHKGPGRGSYIWGRSIHNVRIERLWVDVTTQFGSKWANFFENLEISHGLNVHNPNHVWLLHYLFLQDINSEADFFAGTWNNHKIQMKGQASRRPLDMFVFDMPVLGVRGEQLTLEELDAYGVDWEAIREDAVLSSQLINNSSNEGTSSWIGRVGPPPDLNEVNVDAPTSPLSPQVAAELLSYLSPLMGQADINSLIRRWVCGLAFARSRVPLF
ncbi:hypothetical protein FRC03_004468 [Tulasnella sp. 419]|nr:hypothetical protein FRC03_004468 [Tulasnella sp. 419]